MNQMLRKEMVGEAGEPYARICKDLAKGAGFLATFMAKGFFGALPAPHFALSRLFSSASTASRRKSVLLSDGRRTAAIRASVPSLSGAMILSGQSILRPIFRGLSHAGDSCKTLMFPHMPY